MEKNHPEFVKKVDTLLEEVRIYHAEAFPAAREVKPKNYTKSPKAFLQLAIKDLLAAYPYPLNVTFIAHKVGSSYSSVMKAVSIMYEREELERVAKGTYCLSEQKEAP